MKRKSYIENLLTISTTLILLIGCADQFLPETPILQKRNFEEIRDWEKDHQIEAAQAFLQSCEQIMKKDDGLLFGRKIPAGKASDWKIPCLALYSKKPKTDQEAREFFEQYFIPYTIKNTSEGLFTGYYEMEIKGSRKRHSKYQIPIWGRPKDLVVVNLGDFRPDLIGQRIVGKVMSGKLVPYENREEIEKGAIYGRARPIFWADDAVSVFFLEIQGSGIVNLPNGQKERIGYDAQNGHPYVPIGRVLVEKGEIKSPVTMQKIRDWLKAHPDKAQETMNSNPSVVFFRRTKKPGPVGTEGSILTPGRSLAVDPNFIPLGAPLWLDLKEDENGLENVSRLVIAQDTGGAIKGMVRGDLFFGTGPHAEAKAGVMQMHGTYYLLLPKTVKTDVFGG